MVKRILLLLDKTSLQQTSLYPKNLMEGRQRCRRDLMEYSYPQTRDLLRQI